VNFQVWPFRVRLLARDRIVFPPSGAANLLRGAFGAALRRAACVPDCPGFRGRSARECERKSCEYARIFEPTAQEPAPSGFRDLPRPFVFRTAHLAGSTIEAGEAFWFGVNLFEMRRAMAEHFGRAFREIGCAGLGRERAQAEFTNIEPADGAPISICLTTEQNVRRMRVEFLTPTEIKSAGVQSATPNFASLFARARDRVSTLRALYGAGPLEIDFRALGERSRAILLTRSEMNHVDMKRRSSRTGQVHGIGGLVGWAEYEGDLGEFLPYLEAARWTGVGRQCVWGKGEIRPRVILSS